jgi:hypothetical protein
MLYFTLVRSRLEYVSVACNILTPTDASKFELIQRKFLALCHNCLFPLILYSCVNDLVVNVHTLCTTKRHLDAPIFVNVYNWFKFCSPWLHTVGIRVPIRNFRDFTLLLLLVSRVKLSLLHVHQPQTLFSKILVSIFRIQLVIRNWIIFECFLIIIVFINFCSVSV